MDTFRQYKDGIQMPKTHSVYAPEYRRLMVELVRSGRTPRELTREFERSASRATAINCPLKRRDNPKLFFAIPALIMNPVIFLGIM